MATLHPSIAAFFDHLAGGLRDSAFANAGRESRRFLAAIRSALSGPDLVVLRRQRRCGRCNSSRAPPPKLGKRWEQIRRKDDFGAVARAVDQAVQERFGSQVVCSDHGTGEEPAQDWTGAELSIATASNTVPGLTIVLNPELLAAIGGPAGVPGKLATQTLHSADMLMRVEIPVSVSLGRTQMRMKDLLALASGSIVELDQQLSDDVEIRVNNCVIAHGEVVAVDGNYGVRILRMASDRGTE